MELTDAIRSRRMVRSYDPNRRVDPTIVTKLLELAIRAPSAGHTQGWRFLVLDDITSRGRFWDTTAPESDIDSDTVTVARSWLDRMREAPVLVVCFAARQDYLDRYAETDKRTTAVPGRPTGDPQTWPVPYWYVDTGMAALLLLLGAHDVGLAAAFFGVPARRWEALTEAFAVPAGLEPVGVVSLGHPAPDRRSPSLRRGRRPLDEVVAYRSFPVSPADPSA